ncbi:hypothetical protein BpHYR1_013280 [Brachionus plicatilis]|uniref:Uncharacterized protein n=1 Tax=Brachionus plicatilis TaxID=10195 RepID=A0A3M7SQY9_BRAPC|nr:hypothetical protein BpHYR1_013280 [Brachionus plicatilis]
MKNSAKCNQINLKKILLKIKLFWSEKALSDRSDCHLNTQKPFDVMMNIKSLGTKLFSICHESILSKANMGQFARVIYYFYDLTTRTKGWIEADT